jgi:hypothetical protein
MESNIYILKFRTFSKDLFVDLVVPTAHDKTIAPPG